MINSFKGSFVSMVIGKKGSGKTTLTLKLIEKVKKEKTFKRIIAIDFNNQFGFTPLGDSIGSGEYSIIPENTDEDFERICFLMNNVKNTLWVFDDFDLYNSKNKNFEKFLIVMRQYKSGLIVNNRRPKNITLLLMNQIDDLYCFKVSHPVDLQFLSNWISPEFSDSVHSLKQYKFQYHNFND